MENGKKSRWWFRGKCLEFTNDVIYTRRDRKRNAIKIITDSYKPGTGVKYLEAKANFEQMAALQ